MMYAIKCLIIVFITVQELLSLTELTHHEAKNSKKNHIRQTYQPTFVSSPKALGALRELRHRQVLNSRRGNKRSVNEKDESSMLPLDSSNSFERAIQTDIEELNNPTAPQEKKRSDTPNQPGSDTQASSNLHPQPPPIPPPDVGPQPPEAKTKLRDPTKRSTITPPGSANPTDPHDYFTIHFIEQQHYLAAIERERLRYLCTLTKKENCSALPDHASYVDTTFPRSEPSPGAMPQLSSLAMEQLSSVDPLQSIPMEMLQSSPMDVLQSSQPTGTKPSPSAVTIPPPGNVIHNPESLIHNETSTCTPWSGWGSCSDFCSNGVQLRYRECYNELAVKAADKEFRACSDPDCLYCSQWSPFSPCSKTCGTGTKARSRNCYMKNSSIVPDIDEVSCNFHPCVPECGPWGSWSECSKPCDTGVTIRKRPCTLPDNSVQTFYEHRACNVQPCKTPGEPEKESKSDSSASIVNDTHHPDDDGCLSAHISFDRFQHNVMTIYDNTDEHNDVEFHNTVMFNGNMSCGYSGVLTGRYSVIKFYDDIYRNFDFPQLSVLMWVYPIRISIVANKKQTLFHFSSKRYKYGNYTFVLDEDYHAILSYTSEVLKVTATTTDPIKYDKWHHFAAVYSQEKETILFYINGQPIPLQQTRSVVGMSPSATLESTGQEGFQGFGNDDKLSSPFSGVVDEIYVFKCPISPDMIKNIANTCNIKEGRDCPSPTHGICPEKLPYELDEQIPAPDASQPSATPLNVSP